MVSINSRLIDEYNYSLNKIYGIEQIDPEYVVLINTGNKTNPGGAGTNKKIAIGLLKDYINQYIEPTESDSTVVSVNDKIKELSNKISNISSDIDNIVNQKLNGIIESIGLINNKCNEYDNRIDTLEKLVSLT